VLNNDWVFGLVGAGGFGREVMHIAMKNLRESFTTSLEGHIYFVESFPRSSMVNGIPCISVDDFLGLKSDLKLFNIAIADSGVRESIAQQFLKHDLQPVLLQSEYSHLMESQEFQSTAIICSFATVSTNVHIGQFFHANINTYVAHDCVIGDFVTFGPGVLCLGNVHVGDHAFIGAGAIIREGSVDKPRLIGEGAVIGMGSVVTRDVPPFTTVIGNPAKPIVSKLK
jgi:sugar O-acyltransferase (sialic acid O-acetyltransferase NeuD family)